ncbi:hypothetical protein ACHAO8_000701 [Botrytis cinerea]
MARNNYEDTLSSISSSQNLPQRPKSRFQSNRSISSSSSSRELNLNSTNTQHHTVSDDSHNTLNYFDPDDSAEQCFMSTELDIERLKRKQTQRPDIDIRDTAKKYNRWSPRREPEISANIVDFNNFFEDFTGGSSQINGTNSSSRLAAKLQRLDRLDQDHTPCRVPKSKMSERSNSVSKNNSKMNTRPAPEYVQPANTPRRVVKNPVDDHEFSLDLSHPVHNKENILPKQRPYISASSQHEKIAQADYNERQVLAELETLIKDHPANASIKSGRFAKAASPTFTMSTTVNGSFAIPEVQNITKLVDNTSTSLLKKIEILEQPAHPMGKEEVDIYRSIDELQQQVAILLNERKERDFVINSLQKERRERDSIMSSLQRELNEKSDQDNVISTLRNEKKAQDAIISTLRNEKRAQGEVIFNLEDEKRAHDEITTTLRTQNNHMNETIRELERDAHTQRQENKQMMKSISNVEAMARSHQTEKKAMEKTLAEISSSNEELKADIENISKQRDMVLARYKNLVERFDTLQHSAAAETSQRPVDAEISQSKEHQNIETSPDQLPKTNEALNGQEKKVQHDGDEDEEEEDCDEADMTIRPTMEPQLALEQIMANVRKQIEQLSAQHAAKSAELRALDKSKNLRLRRSLAESLKMLVDQISSHSDFLYRLKDVSYAF